MAKRRYQDPEPFREGKFWWILYREDVFVNGKPDRKRKRHKLGPSEMLEAEAKRLAADKLRPLNAPDNLATSAISFEEFIETIYMPQVTPLIAKSTYDRTRGVLDNCLLPAFGKERLRDLSSLKLQSYFSTLETSTGGKPLTFESRDKIRDVFSSALGYAHEHEMLQKNPLEIVKVPRPKRGRKRSKPYLTTAQFEKLITLIPEPYATMVFVAIFTGLRVSELIGLKWNDVIRTETLNENGEAEDRYALSIDERCCRGDWGEPKSDASNATIGINRCVFERIHRLKILTVEVRAGCAVRKHKVVKSDGPDDLVFQSVRTGQAMRDNNILVRFFKPAARKLGLDWVNWRCLRTSHATWLKKAGADVKDAQAQMRHSRASTTLDLYQQFIPESQHRVVDKLSTLRVN